mmetsp:Transcript_14801/g.19523  ORF Transcript_14801/g.19523 Transcript_14801/m.19523 type:complete len:88 (+) Transcript_14801:2373-2636(+)
MAALSIPANNKLHLAGSLRDKTANTQDFNLSNHRKPSLRHLPLQGNSRNNPRMVRSKSKQLKFTNTPFLDPHPKEISLPLAAHAMPI